MQNEYSGGVLTGLIFSTLFLVAIGSLSWAPRMRIVDGDALAARAPIAVDAPALAQAPNGYALASDASVPVKLAPRRSFARRSHWGETHSQRWRSSQVLAAPK